MADQEHKRIASVKDTSFHYGPNSFRLLRLPVPRPGEVLGIVGRNGIGKTTAIELLSGSLKPNLGRFHDPPEWKEIFNFFIESELHGLHCYFYRLIKHKMKTTIKSQNGLCIPEFRQGKLVPKAVHWNVGQCLTEVDERDMKQQLAADLELIQVMNSNVESLSGGEFQRLAIAMAAVKNADVYLFDEPSSYLDVKQRLKAAHVIRSLLLPNIYVIVVEHDLTVLDYLSDCICCFYGKPGSHGAATLPFSVKEGINIFLDGYVPTEKFRFRGESLTLKESAEEIETYATHRYPTMTKSYENFRLKVVEGEFTDSQIIVMLGENGTGKSTFLQMLGRLLMPDPVEGSNFEIHSLEISYKPQKMGSKSEATVKSMLHKLIQSACKDPQFVSNVMKPLLIQKLVNKKLVDLSGGELQRVLLTLCLGKPADLYLIDEPSAFLDSELRIVASKVIKNFIRRTKKTAFVAEHDFIMATYLADRLIVYQGVPSINCVANPPQPLVTGMNIFLSNLDITGRRDPTNFRPRINKPESTLHLEQKSTGCYYYMDD
ncbi:ABC transporter E family member 2-like isoform X2 [Salvia hispanica]|uniref:ABC transporter E family member 2-like isoform X2 n=1 Tax=Salvia hispanica TaxID=49212 RepID=UPI002009220B|nr:ABC transporter E family member 2-like isoform X2 [Salvia hispanica]